MRKTFVEMENAEEKAKKLKPSKPEIRWTNLSMLYQIGTYSLVAFTVYILIFALILVNSTEIYQQRIQDQISF